jgi:hypothetical protein
MAPSDCPKGDNIFRERAEEGVCKVCGQREEERREEGRVRRDGERRGVSRERRGVSRERHSKERHDSRGESVERHDVRDESLESVSSVRSDSTERGDRHREKDRGDGHDKSKGDGGQEKKDKKKNDKGGSWDATLGLVLQGLEYAAS